jgi:hypothetical protein
MDGLLSTVQQYVSTETLIWLTALSFVFFIGTLIAIPFILVRLSADYFDVRVPRPWMQHHHPVLRIVGLIVKNVLGTVFLFAGFLMLFLPGQGVPDYGHRDFDAGFSRKAENRGEAHRPAHRPERDQQLAEKARETSACACAGP